MKENMCGVSYQLNAQCHCLNDSWSGSEGEGEGEGEGEREKDSYDSRGLGISLDGVLICDIKKSTGVNNKISHGCIPFSSCVYWSTATLSRIT